MTFYSLSLELLCTLAALKPVIVLVPIHPCKTVSRTWEIVVFFWGAGSILYTALPLCTSLATLFGAKKNNCTTTEAYSKNILPKKDFSGGLAFILQGENITVLLQRPSTVS